MRSVQQVLGGFSDAHRYEDTNAEQLAAHEAEVRSARAVAARRSPYWRELDGPALVWRPAVRAYVHADTDAMYREHPGTVFAPGTSTPVAELADLAYTVGAEGGLRFYERLTSTYTEHLQRQAAKERRRRGARA